ncbi:GNAT family N-acetyltransferase [Mucilaginibacter dorajii]|uniref:GNAT family protein n=1 Tax=Mucilaginibacter dorajii TaxID=692994 RepID=A0ABP7QD57_9SPHI|nr:GNAT family N-acetyltransferase [Mucilaginibacter dorajii]MCS3733224.1 ribosomal-protein-alanine N-acetyltransferase [Mucilaginibacter dorajii]
MSIQFPSTEFPVLQTNRLVCRELTKVDGEQLLSIRNNEEINRFIGRSSAQTLQHVLEFIDSRKLDWKERKGVYWTIELKSTGKLIGNICFWNLDYNAATAEIGYELLPAEQGKGLMTETVDKVIAYGFETMQLDAMTACLSPDNKPSVKLLELHGFTYTETIDELLVYKLTCAQWGAK